MVLSHPFRTKPGMGGHGVAVLSCRINKKMMRSRRLNLRKNQYRETAIHLLCLPEQWRRDSLPGREAKLWPSSAVVRGTAMVEPLQSYNLDRTEAKRREDARSCVFMFMSYGAW
jgi:hypothetical protein